MKVNYEGMTGTALQKRMRQERDEHPFPTQKADQVVAPVNSFFVQNAVHMLIRGNSYEAIVLAITDCGYSVGYAQGFADAVARVDGPPPPHDKYDSNG